MQQDTELQEQIKSLRREIEKLSAALALKKLESSHPAFHRLVEELGRTEDSVKAKGKEAMHLGSEIVNHIKNCPYRHIVGRILGIGLIGCAVSLALEWLINEGKK